MSRYHLIRVPVEHPMAVINSSLSKNGVSVLAWEHRIVLFDKIGYGPHCCHWCGRSLRWTPGAGCAGGDSLMTDHLDGDPRNNDPCNLVASCQGCNAHRVHPFALVGDDEQFVVQDGKRIRAVESICSTCGTSFLRTHAAMRRKGAGRYCSMRCVYDRNR